MKAQFPWDATKSQAKFFITEMNVLSDTIKINKMTIIWHEDMQIDIQIYRYTDICLQTLPCDYSNQGHLTKLSTNLTNKNHAG